MKMLFKPYLTL